MQRHYYTNSNFSLSSNNSSNNKSNRKEFNTESDDSYIKSFMFGPHSGRSNYSGNTPLTTISSQGNLTERTYQNSVNNKLCIPALFGTNLNMNNSIIQNNPKLFSSFQSTGTLNNNYSMKRINTSNSNENSQTSNIINNTQFLVNLNNNMMPRHMYSNSELTFREPFSLNMSAINFYKNNNYQNPINKKQIIDLEKVALGIEKRTTIMIRNLPIKYKIDVLEKELASFQGKFNCIYMPFDYENGANKGYAFINLVNPYHILLLYDKFMGKSWKYYESKKICELNFAKFQGIEEIKKHANNYKGIKKPTFYDNENIKSEIEVPKRYLSLILEKYPKLEYLENKDNNTIIINSFG